MIEKLNKKDIGEAAKFYNQGLLTQIPKWKSTLKNNLKKLNETNVFVYKEKNKIKGIVVFEIFENKKLKLDFIYASEMRKGIGRKVIEKVVKLTLKNKVKEIFSEVSHKDKRVMKFYENCGFKKYGEHKVDKRFTLILVKTKPESVLKLEENYK